MNYIVRVFGFEDAGKWISMPESERKPLSEALKKDYSKLLATIATTIAKLRKKHRLSQEELAEELGYSTRFIQRLEDENCAPTLLTLVRVARYFGVSISELLKD